MAAYRDGMLDAELSPHTVKRRLSILSHLYVIATREWRIGGLINLVPNIPIPLPDNGRNRRLVGDEYSRLMASAAIYGGEIGPIITWAIETPMRRGEIAAMRWEFVDRNALAEEGGLD